MVLHHDAQPAKPGLQVFLTAGCLVKRLRFIRVWRAFSATSPAHQGRCAYTTAPARRSAEWTTTQLAGIPQSIVDAVPGAVKH